jgi:hypothetical protein
MDWKNSSKGYLPEHNQEVLISIDSKKFIAVYNHIEKGFFLKDQNLKFIAIKNNSIYWTEIKKP